MKIIILFTFVMLGVKIYAQDTGYEKWLNNEKNNFDTFISKEDINFAEFLKKEWIKAPLIEVPPILTKPLPINPPRFEKEKPKLIEPTKTELPKSGQENNEQPTVVNQIDKSSKSEIRIVEGLDLSKNPLSLSLNFYGRSVKYKYKSYQSVVLEGPVSHESIAKYWENMSSSNYEDCIKQVNFFRENMRLNDYGYASLLYQLGKQIFRTTNEANLFAWFMLVKSGYLSRCAYNDNDVYLIAASKDKLFSCSYFTPSGSTDKYYVIPIEPGKENNSNQVTVYKEDFPGSNKYFSFSFSNVPLLGSEIIEREIKYHYKGMEKKLILKTNKALIKFLEYYPQINFNKYPLMDVTDKSSLLGYLKQEIKDRTADDKLNYLLHFVQQATDYKTDDEQFRRKKCFFPEESAYYKYSDCKCRAVFYTYLIHHLLDIDVLLLDYPDHICAAVLLNEEYAGDYVLYNNKKYLICDPTYIGADIGKCMPKYKPLQPEILDIKW
jgi:hypothetical protein